MLWQEAQKLEIILELRETLSKTIDFHPISEAVLRGARIYKTSLNFILKTDTTRALTKDSTEATQTRVYI